MRRVGLDCDTIASHLERHRIRNTARGYKPERIAPGRLMGADVQPNSHVEDLLGLFGFTCFLLNPSRLDVLDLPAQSVGMRPKSVRSLETCAPKVCLNY